MIPLQIPFFRFVSSALSFALHDKIRDVVVHIFGMSCKPDLSWCAHPKWSYCAGFVLYVKWERHATRQEPNRRSPGSLSMVLHARRARHLKNVSCIYHFQKVFALSKIILHVIFFCFALYRKSASSAFQRTQNHLQEKSELGERTI